MADEVNAEVVAENPVQETTTPTGDVQPETAPSTVTTEEAPKEEANTEVAPKAGKSFTQDEVNSMMSERVGKIYSKYGFKSADELDSAIGKSQSYDITRQRYEATSAENIALKAENAMLKNDIDPSKYEDVSAYFAGKKIAIDNQSLSNEIKTHPEWLRRVASVTPIGAISNPPDVHAQEKFDKEMAEAMGYPGFAN